ncbi:MAG: ATP-grasp domain-containing protein [Pirellulaceae bacterium]|nr:ATP-grasp domain-containing protein [Pirellulaceae bacterium]
MRSRLAPQYRWDSSLDRGLGLNVFLFEWIWCGGMHAVPLAQIPSGMKREAWAMMCCLAERWYRSGHRAVSWIDRRIDPAGTFSGFKGDTDVFALNKTSSALNQWDATLEVWLQAAPRDGVSLILAPESDGLLEYCIARFMDDGREVINCSGRFLQASCDKWLTAQALHAAGVPHPPTWLASSFEPEAIATSERWCLKPRRGAGCEELMIVAAGQVLDRVGGLAQPDNWLVQPWIEGQAFSCSAIVDIGHHAHWLPLVTQKLGPEDVSPGQQRLIYQGGRIVGRELQSERPTQLLDTTLRALDAYTSPGALGWVGVDLLRDSQGRWWSIEVNPRLTTSIVGLAQAIDPNIGRIMIEAWQGPLPAYKTEAMNENWKELEFTAQYPYRS